MGTIANKLTELTRRVSDLEAQIALQAQKAASLGEHGRPLTATNQAIAAMQKRLTSLKRSCQILARHATNKRYPWPHIGDEHEQATLNVSGHVERPEKAMKAFRKEDIDRWGVLLHPISQAEPLKGAREELSKE